MGGRGASLKLKKSSKDFYNKSDKGNFESSIAAEDYLGWRNNGDTDKWYEKLSSSEIKNIQYYTGDGYKAMNKALQENDTESFAWKRAQKLKDALDKSVVSKGIVVHRGDNGAVFNAAGLGGDDLFKTIKAREGYDVSFKGFVSTSTTKPWGGRVQYHITVPQGKGYGGYVKGFSSVSSENEFLINCSVKFKITKVIKAEKFAPNNAHVDVYMKAIK